MNSSQDVHYYIFALDSRLSAVFGQDGKPYLCRLSQQLTGLRSKIERLDGSP